MESSNGWTAQSWSAYDACWTMPDFRRSTGHLQSQWQSISRTALRRDWYAVNPVRGLAWEEANFQASTCVRMLGDCPLSERETKEAGLQSHLRLICWVQHNNRAVLRIRSIGQDDSPLPRCGFQRREAVHSTECCRWSDLEWALLQRCHRGTPIQTHGEATNQTSNGGAIGQRFTSGPSEAEEEVTRIGWPWDVTWRCMEAAGRR